MHTKNFTNSSWKGTAVAMLVLTCWLLAMGYALTAELHWQSPMAYGLFLLLAHLYTGLFITAHDAMHGIVSPNKRLNYWIGACFAALFACNYYPNLLRKHHEHHRHVATEQDPDYHSGGFFLWYLSFAKQYVTVWQILAMAVLFNLLIQIFPEQNVLFYWAGPTVLATLQLFYFGTYLPHRGEHESNNVHKARSQRRNHLWAFLSCYFFGYHYEHHASPGTPWWRLYRLKDQASFTDVSQSA